MLVLSRREQETVVILLPDGREITVKLQELRGNRARISFDAPPDISIFRSEVLSHTHAAAS